MIGSCFATFLALAAALAGCGRHLVTLSPCHLVVFGAEFPRGPGLYFHPAKLAAVALVYLCWVRTCWWVNKDAKELKLPAGLWNAVMLAGGALGLLLVWAV